MMDIGGNDDGKVWAYIYRRDYLKKVTKETGERVPSNKKGGLSVVHTPICSLSRVDSKLFPSFF